MNSELYFFAIPALDRAAATAELNAFLAQHRVLTIDKRWVDAGLDSHWAICLGVAIGAGPLPAAVKVPGSKGAATTKIDYREVLSPADFAVFAALRKLRQILGWVRPQAATQRPEPRVSADAVRPRPPRSPRHVAAIAARWLLERQERPLTEAHRERSHRFGHTRRRQRVWQHPGMDLPMPMDQALSPLACVARRPPKLEGSRGVGSGDAAAPPRQIPGQPPAPFRP